MPPTCPLPMSDDPNLGRKLRVQSIYTGARAGLKGGGQDAGQGVRAVCRSLDRGWGTPPYHSLREKRADEGGAHAHVYVSAKSLQFTGPACCQLGA